MWGARFHHVAKVFFLTLPLAAAQLTLPATTAPPASTLQVPITISSNTASALQFDLQFPSPTLALTPTLADSARAAGKFLVLWQLYPGLWRFVIGGYNATAIPDGPLLNLAVNIRADALPDTYPLQFLNLTAASPSAAPVTLTAKDGSIAVQGDPTSAVRLQSWGVINGASILPGGVAPGEILTLFGASIGPGSVTFDGLPAPLLYNGLGQINLIAPYALTGKSTTELRVAQGDQTIAKLQLPVVPASPAIFTLDASGAGPGAILNQDYSVNGPGNPAAKGSVVMIYATGAGQTDPPGVDAEITGATLPKPLLPVSVKIGNRSVQVQYAGAAPGLISGLIQINCLIPADAPTGIAVPIQVTVGTATSPAGVTLSIR